MRKVLLFLLIFGAGLALLYLSRTTPSGRPARPDVAPPSSVAPGEFTPLPIASNEPGQKGVGVVLDGAVQFTQRKPVGSELLRELELQTSDVDAIGGNVYDAHDLRVELYEPVSGRKRAELVSPLSRLTLTVASGAPRLSGDQPVRLTNVDLTLHEGGPVVPLTLSVPGLDWNVRESSFESADRVRMLGRGLEAEGSGLRASLGDSRFELERDASIHLDLERGVKVELTSGPSGPITITKTSTDAGAPFDLVAKDGARLKVTGAEPFTIDASTIHVVGRPASGADTSFLVDTAEADGDVRASSRGDTFRAQHADFAFGADGRLSRMTLEREVTLQSGADVFSGERAVFEFDAKGLLVKATLTGEPRGAFAAGRFLPKDRRDLGTARVDISGRGPLVVDRARNEVDLAGPARLQIAERDLVLRARDRIVGRDARESQSGDLAATGEVVVDWGKNQIESEALTIAWEPSGGKEPAVTAVSNGSTRVTGETREGRAFTLNALGGLEARSIGNRLTIPVARGVDIRSPGMDEFSARAAEVRELDLVARTFEASGDVVFDSAQGHGSADRVVALGREEFELRGLRGKPARYRFTQVTDGATGTIEAEAEGLEIDVHADRIDARGDVRAFVETSDSRLDLSGAKLALALAPPGVEPRRFHAAVDGAVHGVLVRPGERADVASEHLVVDGTLVMAKGARSSSSIVDADVRAEGDIAVNYAGAGEVTGRGDLFTLDKLGHGRLSASGERRVRVRGRLVGTQVPYALDADWIDFDREHVEAEDVKVELVTAAADVPAPPVEPRGPGGDRAVLREMRAQRLHADHGEILLEGAAHVDGATVQDEPWRIDAGTIRIQGEFQDERSITTDQITRFTAEDGFTAQLGARLEADGDRLEGERDRARITGRPARLTVLDAEWRSERIEYDTHNMLLSTDKGHLSSRETSPGPSWSLDYESMEPFETPDGKDALILALRNPRIRVGPDQLFANWALFWVDRDEWRKSGRKAVTQAVDGPDVRARDPETAPGTPAPERRSKGVLGDDPMARLAGHPLFRVLSEVYVEGDVEFFQKGEREGRAAALYLDLRDTQGWIQDVDLRVAIDIRGFNQELRAKAKWMRIAPGPSLQAADALLTSCDYDEPHYVIETGDLRITPHKNEKDDRVAYEFSASDNRLRLENGFRIPLPAISPDLDEDGKLLIDRFVLGNSAKYGAQVAATFNAELGVVGKATGKVLSRVLRFPEVDLRGNWKFNVGILGSRGVLLGAGLTIKAGEKFSFLTELDVIPDRGSDRGLVRVDEDDRSLLRAWFRSRSRYSRSKDEWFDVAVSRQSDAGVQSEFFERQYVRYEQKDTYVHWRKATATDYFSASAKVRIEDRRDVDELPSLGAFRGRTSVGELFGEPLYYTGRADAGYFRRREGDDRYYAPFEDGLGDRDVLRFDTEHRLEVPFDLGFLAARGTPYLAARATAWDRGEDDDGAIARAALLGGFEASTTFWKRFPGGSIHTITPSLGFRVDVARASSGEDPVDFDALDEPITGRFLDAGVRSRWWEPETQKRFDLDVRISDGDDLPRGKVDGLQPIAVLGEFLTYWGRVPIGLTHDGRFDTRSGNTDYSHTSLGFEPWQSVGLEFGHQRGLATSTDERLYESASVAARWRWTTKWEMELEQSYSIADGRGLGNNFVLRRMGHDFITEIEVSYRAGEGSAFSIGLQPRLTWKRSGLGLLDHWLGVYH